MNWRSTLEQIFPQAGELRAESSSYERFAIPYKFQPRLRVTDAAVFALTTFLRIFLGSVLFGAWGAFSLRTWSSVPNLYLGIPALIALFVTFLALVAAMLILTARLLPRNRPGR